MALIRRSKRVDLSLNMRCTYVAVACNMAYHVGEDGPEVPRVCVGAGPPPKTQSTSEGQDVLPSNPMRSNVVTLIFRWVGCSVMVHGSPEGPQ